MVGKSRTGAAAVAILVAGLVTAPTGMAQPNEPEPSGVFRVGMPRFDFTSGLDPTGEYLGFSWGLFSNLLVRTLVTYRHVAGPEGVELVPDLATEIPEPTDGGRTYTFKLKEGVRFGPPVDRAITSTDIAYAFARLNCAPCGPQYRFYYAETIKGMKPSYRGMTRRPRLGSVRGVETPDENTIVFHLKRPLGDFLHRLALPATGPIPMEVARCFWHAGEYGRYLISSGPYMLRGSEALDIDNGCRAMHEIDGLQYRKGRLDLVRNPNYDPTTDSPEIRENLVDGFHFKTFRREGYMYDAVEHGELEAVIPGFIYGTEPYFEQYRQDPELRDRLHSHPAERTWYVTMNLTQPPFDDVHVRRALNFALDKEDMRDAWGGEIAGEIATHILPPLMTSGHPSAEEYDPYGTPDQHGDPTRAGAEMALSRYDSDADGLCDARACADVDLVSRQEEPWHTMEPVLVRALRSLGIVPDIRRSPDGYPIIQTVRNNVPISLVPGWGKDHPDPESFIWWLFYGPRIICDGNVNYSLVGATEQLQRDCRAKGNFADIPNVDDDIERCRFLPLGDERTNCWVRLDERLMEEVVPWVPYLWANNVRITGPAVTQWEYDQFAGEIGFAHVAVDPARQN